jgi:hypothetical protein
VHVLLLKRSKITANIMAILLVITLIATLSPKAMATPTSITSIYPESGHVGAVVGVIGGIDTVNGSYTIFFDGEETKNGTAVGTAVNDTFIVPHRPLGNYNVTLQDTTTNSSDTFPTLFAVETAYYIKVVTPQPPQQLQEGESTQIYVNVTGGEENTVYPANMTVTDPSGAVYYNDTLQLTNTASTGYGERIITYPAEVSLDARTDYVGVYTLTFNETLATGNFIVGLTDRVEYRSGGTVSIQGSGYNANENVTVNITLAEVPTAGYPKNVTADADGVVKDSWTIPTNAKPGTHTVTLTNATSDGTVKTPADAQNFTVVGAVCLIQTWNRADPPEPVASVIVEANNATTNSLLKAGTTNRTGWVELWLELGNYTFEAFYIIDKDSVLVGGLENQSIAEATTFKLNLTCQLSHIRTTIHDEAKNPLSNIDVKLKYAYTTRDNVTVPKTEHFETNNTGTVTILNTIANTSYEIEASRYGHPFNRTVIENLTFPLWVNITCPTYTIFVHVLDSHDLPIQNVDVAYIEWSSEILMDTKPTNTMGSVAFSSTFGRYKARVYDGSALQEGAIVLNETVTDLIEDHFFLLIRCKIYNIDLSLSIIDYFRQPIPNAVVKVERNGLEFASSSTGRDGTTSLLGIIGGDCRVSVYISGKLSETRTLYLDKDNDLVLTLDKYIVVGGYPLESIQFLAIISLSILVAIFALAILYRRISLTRKKKEIEEGNTRKE